MLRTTCFACILIFSSNLEFTHALNTVKEFQIQEWAIAIGKELKSMGQKVTRAEEFEQAYRNSEVIPINPAREIRKMTEIMENLVQYKINALKNIVNTAERESAKFYEIPDIHYYDIRDNKNLTEEDAEQLTLEDRHFYNIPVTTNFSTVHIPTGTYYGENNTLKAIKWSEELDQVYQHNFAIDSGLSWQYFGSSRGFMRIYPGLNWTTGVAPVDLFDCRMRPWYISAAASPKDVIILLDNSGSMMGENKEIARHTINTILETLGPNDFVNVYWFANDTKQVVPCFDDTLVQANLLTIRELKAGVERMEPASLIANFTIALTKAFKVLDRHRTEKLASMCNQAIMLVTDGAPENFKEIFDEYNWKKNRSSNFPVRVFTYLIGRDDANARQVKWMACANQGYFVNLNTMSEVRQKVFEYIKVMARPLVLHKKNIATWTSLYADVTDPKLTDWLWEDEQNSEQREYSIEYRKDAVTFVNQSQQIARRKKRIKKALDQNTIYELSDYKLITTVSMPAFDKNESMARIAELLGVAATDVPLGEFKRIMKPYILGVNNYGFIVNNNGYIILHPDLRPIFQNKILKPGYNSVDLTDVELVDDDNEPRNFSKDIILLRDMIINHTQTTTSNESRKDFHFLNVRYHYDDMRRASTSRRFYHMRGIADSPFTAVLALLKTGTNRVRIPDMGRYFKSRGETYPKLYFDDPNWRIHPEWHYCKYISHDRNSSFDSIEEELKHFLDATRFPGWDWTSMPYDVKYANISARRVTRENKRPPYYCDEELMHMLLHDANVTQLIFSENGSPSLDSKDDRKGYADKYQISDIFVSTHSGFTRWIPLGNDRARQFGDVFNRAIDEVWYKRAVEQHFAEPKTFVFGSSKGPGPNVGPDDPIIIASRAIFVQNNGDQAPVAVVGFQFQKSALKSLVENITCKDQKYCQSNIWNSEEKDVYVVDNNGYILVSNRGEYDNMFLGVPQPTVFQNLLDKNIFKKITIYDYQGVCFHGYHEFETSDSSSLSKPFLHMKQLTLWLLKSIWWYILTISVNWYPVASHNPEPIDGFIDVSNLTVDQLKIFRKVKKIVMLNRTRPLPCDRKIDLYQLHSLTELQKVRHKNMQVPQSDNEINYEHERIPGTNLLLIVSDPFPENQDYVKFETFPTEVCYNQTFSFLLPTPLCYKVKNNWFSRLRPTFCCNEHPKEHEIHLCGTAAGLRVDKFIFISLLTIFYYLTQF